MSDRGQQKQLQACREVSQLLPFYLNGSLDEVAAHQVRSHLATCNACLQEERDTRTVWDLYEGHLPVELILDVALDQPMSPQRRQLVEDHLATCERCAAEVTLARQAPAEGTSKDSTLPGSAFGQSELLARRKPPAVPLKPGHWQGLAWAACLATLIATGGWFWTWQQLRDTGVPISDAAVRPNISVVELLPATQPLLRHDSTHQQSAANQVQLPDDADELVLVLLSGGDSCASGCSLEIYATGDDALQWAVQGLMPNLDGHVTLILPRHRLPTTRSVLVVRNQASGELVTEYLVEASLAVSP